MGLRFTFGYMAKQFTRRPGRALFGIIGILISVSLLMGINISMNAMGRSVYGDMLDNVPVDIVVTSDKTDNNYTRLITPIYGLRSEYSEIESAEVTTNLRLDVFINTTIDWSYLASEGYPADNFTDVYFLGINKSLLDNERFLKCMHIVKKGDDFDKVWTSPNYTLISEKAARDFGLEVGDTFSFGIYVGYYNYSELNPKLYNYTSTLGNITVAGIVSVTDYNLLGHFFAVRYSSGSYNLYIYEETPLFFFGLPGFYDAVDRATDFPVDYTEISYTSSKYNPTVLIFLDRSKLDITDPDRLTAFFDKLETSIRYSDPVLKYSVRNNDSDLIGAVNMQINFYKALVYLASLPIIILGWYIIRTNVYLILEKRRREIGLLKIRGAKNREIFSVLLGESFVNGIIGGLAGMMVGYISAAFILSNINYMGGNLAFGAILSDIFRPTVSDIIMAAVFGVGITVLASLDPLKRFVKLTPIDAVAKYNPEIQAEEKPFRAIDWLLLAVSVGTIFFYITVGPQIGTVYNSPVFIIIGVLWPVMMGLMPVAPFILIYELVKFVTVYLLGLFKKIVSGFAELFTKKTSFFVTKSIIGNRARSARIITIIAVMFAFLIIGDGLTYQVETYREDYNLIYLGGDANIAVYDSSGSIKANGTLPYINYLLNLTEPRISDISVVGFISRISVFGSGDITAGGIYLQLIDPDNYTAHFKRSLDKFIVGDTAEHVFSALKTVPNATLISEAYADKYGFEVGDRIILDSFNISLNVIGIYTVLPCAKFSPPGSIGFWNVYTLICNTKITENLSDYSIDEYHFMINYDFNGTEPDADTLKDYNKKVVNALSSFDSSISVESVSVQTFIGNMIFNLLEFTAIQKYYMVSLVAFGIGLIIFMNVGEKAYDYALLKARGMDIRTGFKTQLSEGLIFLIMGALIGATGIISSYSLNRWLYVMTSMNTGIPIDFVIPLDVLIPEFLVIIAIFMGIIAAATYYMVKRSPVEKLAEILRTA